MFWGESDNNGVLLVPLLSGADGHVLLVGFEGRHGDGHSLGIGVGVQVGDLFQRRPVNRASGLVLALSHQGVNIDRRELVEGSLPAPITPVAGVGAERDVATTGAGR